MEKLLFSAVTGALGPVLGKLGALLGEEYKLVEGVRGKIMFLETEVEAMHAFLLKMSWVEEPDEQAKCWMKDVRELSYDIHNSIDDFMLRVDDGESAKPKGFKGFIKRSVDLLTKTRTRRRIGKEVRSLETLVKEAAERRGRYKIDDNVSKASNTTVDPRVCAMYKDLSELVGIAGPTFELVNLLNSGVAGAPPQELKVAPPSRRPSQAGQGCRRIHQAQIAFSEDTAHALGIAAAERQPTAGDISRRRLPRLSTSSPERDDRSKDLAPPSAGRPSLAKKRAASTVEPKAAAPGDLVSREKPETISTHR
ncbi:hypothetical protein QYE76_058565 [Lolium multiflorum]|uniref:Disease resistance N-terminal domain-containing protein n=1 Tax=Lolium multiflorum TaxID=4521 RepID=A0AAD8WQ43_LOLMU|nr:hypothetical protein QYE76_058565 [Lolium multiflorum]